MNQPDRPARNAVYAELMWPEWNPTSESYGTGAEKANALLDALEAEVRTAAPAAQSPAAPAARLSETERRMLEYALDLADEEVARDGSEFSDDEEDALAELRRLAGEQPAQNEACAHSADRHGPEAGCVECRCQSTVGHAAPPSA